VSGAYRCREGLSVDGNEEAALFAKAYKPPGPQFSAVNSMSTPWADDW